MNRQPDVELVLRDYFADDGFTAPDHVLDVVEERIARQPRRLAWRLRGRPFVNTFTKLAAGMAAVLIVAVVAFRLMPGGSSGGGTATPVPTITPTATPTPTLSPAPSTLSATPSQAGSFGGTVQYRDTGMPFTAEIDAVASGATVTGTAVYTSRDGTHTVRLGCAARDGDTWALAGTVEQSTIPGETAAAGYWSRVVVKDASPPQISIWLSADAPTDIDCATFLATFPFADLGPENFIPVESGELVPPPDLAP
jgi:hypothetical protein